jgi:hypothetical protein
LGYAATVAIPSDRTCTVLAPFPAATVATPIGTIPVPGSTICLAMSSRRRGPRCDDGAYELRQLVHAEGLDFDALVFDRVDRGHAEQVADQHTLAGGETTGGCGQGDDVAILDKVLYGSNSFR